jgi:hypothetical protein
MTTRTSAAATAGAASHPRLSRGRALCFKVITASTIPVLVTVAFANHAWAQGCSCG